MNFLANAEAKSKIWDMIKDIRICLLVTQDEQNRLFARPMAAQERDDNGQLWYFTTDDSPKVKEIQANPNVLLSYSDPSKNNYVSLSGTASIVHDREKIAQLWSEILTVWFPKGKDDPSICLIRFQPDSAEYWDAPSSTFIHAYGYVKAKLTGEAPKAGDNQQVKMAS